MSYTLPSYPYCNQHPNKRVEFFNFSNQFSNQLFCSSCIHKNQIPCNQQELIDIEEFLYQQKNIQDAKGLNSDPEIYKYLNQRKNIENDYKQHIEEEKNKFTIQINKIMEQIQEAFEQMKRSIVSQLQQIQEEFLNKSSNLYCLVCEQYQQSILFKNQSFEQLINSYETQTHKGLQNLLETLFEDQKSRNENTVYLKPHLKNILQTQQREIKVKQEIIDSLQTQSCSFQEKILQTIPNLINYQQKLFEENDSFQTNIQESLLQENSSFSQSRLFNQTISNQVPQNVLQTIKMDQIRKIQQTQDFPSGHQRAIYCICSFQNNSKIATGGEDNTIRLWDLQNMECYLILKGHTDGIRDLISLPNGYLISASYDKTIKMWNIPQQLAKQDEIASTPKDINQQQSSQQYLIKSLKGHICGVICLLYLSGQFMASGSADYTIKIWDLQSGETLKTISGHSNEVLCLCQPFRTFLGKKYSLFENQRCLVSGSSDNSIKVWRINKKNHNANEVRTLLGHKDYVFTIVFLPDDITLVSGSYDKCIFVWNIHTGSIIAKMESHFSQITKVALFADKVIVSSSADGTVKFWDLNIKQCVHSLEGHKGPCNNFSVLLDGNIWSVGSDRNIHVWE